MINARYTIHKTLLMDWSRSSHLLLSQVKKPAILPLLACQTLPLSNWKPINSRLHCTNWQKFAHGKPPHIPNARHTLTGLKSQLKALSITAACLQIIKLSIVSRAISPHRMFTHGISARHYLAGGLKLWPLLTVFMLSMVAHSLNIS